MQRLRAVGWLYALSAASYLFLLAMVLFYTLPIHFSWLDISHEYIEALAAFIVPFAVSAWGAWLLLVRRDPSAHVNVVLIALSVFVCATLLLLGWGILVFQLAVSALLLAYRTYRVRA
jgi:hypothetical protein